MRFLDRLQPLALLLMRVALGAIFIAHGWQKAFGGMQSMEKMVSGMGFPWWMAYLVTAAELGGGILVLGVHDVDLLKNDIANNDFFGIAVINYCVAVYGTPFDCTQNPPAADPKPAYNVVAKNTLTDNHGAPPPPSMVGPFSAYASDILEIVTI